MSWAQEIDWILLQDINVFDKKPGIESTWSSGLLDNTSYISQLQGIDVFVNEPGMNSSGY